MSESQLAACPTRAVVARMLRNVKAIALGKDDFPSAIHVQRRLAAVAREDPVEQRDLGMICLRVDRPGEAIDPLEGYLHAAPTAEDASSVADLVRSARRLLHDGIEETPAPARRETRLVEWQPGNIDERRGVLRFVRIPQVELACQPMSDDEETALALRKRAGTSNDSTEHPRGVCSRDDQDGSRERLTATAASPLRRFAQ